MTLPAGELPADEADLLAANITGLAEMLMEISALSRQSDAAPSQLPNGELALVPPWP